MTYDLVHTESSLTMVLCMVIRTHSISSMKTKRTELRHMQLATCSYEIRNTVFHVKNAYYISPCIHVPALCIIWYNMYNMYVIICIICIICML